MSADVTVIKNPGRRRYEASAEAPALAGFIDYQETSELVVLSHTEVDPSFEGQGIGSILARAALEDIGALGLKAIVVCPFILGWLRNHPEYQAVLYTAPASHVTD